MSKRIIFVFGSFSLIVGILAVRVITIAISEYSQIALNNATRSFTVSESRGQIYDCNLNRLTSTESEYFAAIKPTKEALEALKKVLDKETLKSVSENIAKGMPQIIKVDESNINCKDITIVKTFKRYGDNQLAAHIIGYLDGSKSEGLYGLEKGYNDFLSSAYGCLRARFDVDAIGRVLSGKEISVINENYNSNVGICLTIDKNIQTIAENAMDNNDVTKGAVVIMDVKSGEIKAMASRPALNPNNIASSLNSEDSPFINRAISSYAVGSLFKAIIASAALENGVSENTEFYCNGSIKIGDTVFNCHNHDGHGKINMKEALAQSCNVYFINLIQKFDAEKVISLAEDLGFGQSVDLCENIVSDKGNLTDLSSLSSPGAKANLSFGQGDLLATPVQIAAAFCSICSFGEYREPVLFKGFVDSNGELYDEYKPKPPSKVISDKTAELVKEFLVYTVADGLGKSAMPDFYGAGGKTATAQSGWAYNSEEIFHSWFCGFFPAESPKYVVTILKEDGKSGSIDCTPVFKEIADIINAL